MPYYFFWFYDNYFANNIFLIDIPIRYPKTRTIWFEVTYAHKLNAVHLCNSDEIFNTYLCIYFGFPYNVYDILQARPLEFFVAEKAERYTNLLQRAATRTITIITQQLYQ